MEKLNGATGINAFEALSGQLPELEFILGKKVKVTDKKGEVHLGTLDFVGHNAFFPEWGLCCTVSRQPRIEIHSVGHIEVTEEIE